MEPDQRPTGDAASRGPGPERGRSARCHEERGRGAQDPARGPTCGRLPCRPRPHDGDRKEGGGGSSALGWVAAAAVHGRRRVPTHAVSGRGFVCMWRQRGGGEAAPATRAEDPPGAGARGAAEEEEERKGPKPSGGRARPKGPRAAGPCTAWAWAWAGRACRVPGNPVGVAEGAGRGRSRRAVAWAKRGDGVVGIASWAGGLARWRGEVGGQGRRRKISLTGNRTRAAAVRAPNPNH